MKNLIILFPFLFVSLFSCSPKPIEKTETKILLAATALFPAGGFLIGHNAQTKASFIRKINGDSISLELNNGLWEFAAFGWDGADNMDGTILCTNTAVRDLAGDEQNITLQRTPDCSDDVFGKTQYKNPDSSIKPVSFYSCTGLIGVPNASITSAFDCVSSEGSAQSFSITIFDGEFSTDGSAPLNYVQSGFQSKCISASATHYTAPEIEMPMFEKVPFMINTYSDNNCLSTIGAHLINTTPQGLPHIKKFSDSSDNRIFIEDLSTAGVADPSNLTLQSIFTSGHFLGNNLTINPVSDGNKSLNHILPSKSASLLGYWRFDGDFSDASLNGLNGTAVGNEIPTFSSSSKIGSDAIEFDGSNDKINTGGDSPFEFGTSAPFTFMAWVNTTYTNYQAVLGKFNGGQGYWFGLNNFGKVYFKPHSTPYIFGNTTVNDSAWHHIAATRDASGNFRLYVDGVLDKSDSNSTQVSGAGNLHIGSYGTTGVTPWNGKLDEVAVYSSELSEADIAKIYHKQSLKFSKEIESEILDSRSINPWISLAWRTPLPFGKELHTNSEISADYVQLVDSSGNTGDSNLNNELVGLWHLNENTLTGAANEVIDSSGNGNHGAGVNTSNISSVKGKLNNALKFGGTGSITVTSPSFSNIAQSISFWVRANPGATTASTILEKTLSAQGWQLKRDTNHNFIIKVGGVDVYTLSSSEVLKGDWNHILLTLHSPNGIGKLYVNGIVESSFNFTSNIDLNSTTNLFIAGNASKFKGSLDEVAIWNRVLHASEVLQVYRRGANNIKVQIRTCSSNNCTDQTSAPGQGWKGPGGDSQTYFSELMSNTSYDTSSCGTSEQCLDNEILRTGTIQPTPPYFVPSDFSPNGVTLNPGHQFFQYKVILESSDSSYHPELESIDLMKSP